MILNRPWRTRVDWIYLVPDTSQCQAHLIKGAQLWITGLVYFSRNLSHAVSLDVDIKGMLIGYLGFILEIMLYVVHIRDTSCPNICHRPPLVWSFFTIFLSSCREMPAASQPMPWYLFLNELIIIGTSEQLHILITYFPMKCRKILNFSLMPLIAIWLPVQNT